MLEIIRNLNWSTSDLIVDIIFLLDFIYVCLNINDSYFKDKLYFFYVVSKDLRRTCILEFLECG